MKKNDSKIRIVLEFSGIISNHIAFIFYEPELEPSILCTQMRVLAGFCRKQTKLTKNVAKTELKIGFGLYTDLLRKYRANWELW